MNKASEGMTSQKISMDKLLTCLASFVSSYKKMKAIIEIKGSEAKTAPQKLLRLAISEISMIRAAERTIFIR